MGHIIAIDTPTNLRRRALGGEILRIEVDGDKMLMATRALRQHLELQRVRYSHSEPGVIYVVVDDAGERLPQALDVLRHADDVHVRSAQQYLPPFDEVFVRLMAPQETGDV